MTIGLNTLR
jgi:protein SDA1